MGLDARGGISVLQLLIYIPILVFSAILVKRHGFRKQGGWIFLLILSIGVFLFSIVRQSQH